MPQPTSSMIHVDRPLTNYSERFMNEQAYFAMPNAFPRLPVAKQSDQYYIFTTSYWLTDEMELRAPGGKFARSGYGLSTSHYFAHQKAMEHTIPDENRANSDEGINLDQQATEFVTTKNLIEQERTFAAATMTSTVWTSADASATDWDSSTGVPITAIQRAQQTVQGLTGMVPNALVGGLVVQHGLVTNDQITGLVKYVQPALPQQIAAILANALGLQYVNFSQASYDSAAEGATSSLSRIVDDDALVYYRPATPGLMTPSAAICFDWNGGGGMGVIERWRDESIKSDIVRVYSAYNFKLMSADLGYFFGDVV
jgi:hypothetical protein